MYVCMYVCMYVYMYLSCLGILHRCKTVEAANGSESEEMEIDKQVVSARHPTTLIKRRKWEHTQRLELDRQVDISSVGQ